jgi:hypothetical protein
VSSQLNWDAWTGPRNSLGEPCATAASSTGVAAQLLFVPGGSASSDPAPVCVPACPDTVGTWALCGVRGAAMPPLVAAELLDFCVTAPTAVQTYASRALLGLCLPEAAIAGALYVGSDEQSAMTALVLDARVRGLHNADLPSSARAVSRLLP